MKQCEGLEVSLDVVGRDGEDELTQRISRSKSDKDGINDTINLLTTQADKICVFK